ALLGLDDVVWIRGIERRRRLRHAREQRGLGERELREIALAEVRLRRGLDAVRLIPVVDLVEVELEDLLLRVRSRHLNGEDRLLHLARDAHLVADDALLHELLRDRGCAAHDGVMKEVVADGADDAEDVDAGVGPERLVLGAERRVDDDLGHLIERHDLAALDLELVEERLAGAVVDLRRERERVLRKVFRGGEIRAEERERSDRPDRREADARDEEGGQDRREDGKPSTNAAPTSAPQLAIRTPP